MSTAYVALGANQGDRLHNLEEAVRLVSEIGEIHAMSPIYETEPVGFADQPWFLNAVMSVDTDLSPLALLLALQDVERKLGKATPFTNGPRTIDLDMLLYDDLVQESPDLALPHPRMHERRFVLTPLADIAPDVTHPTEHATVSQLLNSLRRSDNDHTQVHPWAQGSKVFPNHNRRTEIRD
jgi:2-amino-4-hydroxy-6-hydroxymethyldihydropteridine diphosphokinase